MNFAEAIRQAAISSGAHPLTEKADEAVSENRPVMEQESVEAFSTPVPKETNPMPQESQAFPPPEPRLEVIEVTPTAKQTESAHGFQTQPIVEAMSEEESEIALDAITSEPIDVPQAPTPAASGTAVRLELFLSPEQLNSLFRAVVANQHSVMTLREAANYLRVSPSTLETMAQEGQIPAFLIDGRWRFPRNSVDEWLNMQSFRKEMEA